MVNSNHEYLYTFWTTRRLAFTRRVILYSALYYKKKETTLLWFFKGAKIVKMGVKYQYPILSPNHYSMFSTNFIILSTKMHKEVLLTARLSLIRPPT